MDRRLLGNILITTFIMLSITGIIMYFMPFKKSIASLHTFFALLFITAVILHIVNNKLPLINYITGKRQKQLQKLQSPFVFTILILTTISIYFGNPFFNALYNFGNDFRNEQIGKTETTFDYQIINLDKAKGNKNISIELKKGTAFNYPLFAVWAEDSLGNYIETLYVSRVIASSTFDYGTKVGDQWEAAVVRRPEALPYWSHKRGKKAPDGLYMPYGKSPDLDAASGATPTNNFVLHSKSSFKTLSNYQIFLEVNQSYDWNAYYTKDKFPNDTIYSGSGQVGQPSLIYTATFNTNAHNKKTHAFMQLIGHGHHSGENGRLYTNLENISTAKHIIDRLIVSVKE